jgi:hypothetical protein
MPSMYGWLLRWNLKCCSPHSCHLNMKLLNTATVRLHFIHPTLPNVDFKNACRRWNVHKPTTMYRLSFYLMLTKHASPSKSNNLFLLALRMYIRPIPCLTSTDWPPYLVPPTSRVANALREKSLKRSKKISFKQSLYLNWYVHKSSFMNGVTS